MLRDRFGNEHAPGVPYARGKVLTGTEDDFRKVRQAWRHIETHVAAGGPPALINFSGLTNRPPLEPPALPFPDDLLPPPPFADKFTQATPAHFRGRPPPHPPAPFTPLPPAA